MSNAYIPPVITLPDRGSISRNVKTISDNSSAERR